MLRIKLHPFKTKMHPPLNRNCTPYTVSIKIRVICRKRQTSLKSLFVSFLSHK